MSIAGAEMSRLDEPALSPAGVAQLEEIARQLSAIHVSLATNLDGGRELQTWARHQIEDVLTFIDLAIDRAEQL